MRYFPWRIQILDVLTKTLSIIGIYNQYLLRKMDNSMLSFLTRDYSEWIKNYKNLPIPEHGTDNSGTIWVCWFQGEENAPLLVKKCIESIRRNAGSHPVILITLENYMQYVDMPEHIMKLALENQITLTQLSDILRIKLLATHGGMWIDSTMFYCNPLNEDLWNEPFFSPPKTMFKKNHAFDSRMNDWGVGFQMAQKQHPLYICLSDFYDLFYLKYPIEPHYFLVDYIGYIVLSELGVRNTSALLMNNHCIYVYMINSKKAGEVAFEEFLPTHLFYVTYKKKWPERDKNGNLTVYGQLISM